MKSVKTGLLIAAALAVVPAMAQAEERERDWGHGEHRDRAPRDRGQQASRPTPPQAQRPQFVPPPQAQAERPQFSPPPQGRFNGAFGGRPAERDDRRDQRAQWQGNRGNWDRGEVRPAPPQVAPDRSQWRNGGQNIDRRDTMNVQTDDRRYDGRHSEDRREGYNRDYRGGDRRWGNNYRVWNGNDRHWDRGDRDRYRHNPNWRNDRRYDWRSWRNSHRYLYSGRYYAPRGYRYRSVYRGFYLEPFFYGSTYWLSDPYEYRLPVVEWPLRWVRYYDDALLVDTTTGEVIDVIQNFFF